MEINVDLSNIEKECKQLIQTILESDEMWQEIYEGLRKVNEFEGKCCVCESQLRKKEDFPTVEISYMKKESIDHESHH